MVSTPGQSGVIWSEREDRTSDPPVPWIVPALAGVPFGFSCAIIMQGLVQYLMDAYSIYCSSAIASTVVTRSVVAAIFPLISPTLYGNLGDSWACSVFAFLAAACMPVPFLFYVSCDCHYGMPVGEVDADKEARNMGRGSEASRSGRCKTTGL